MTGVDQRGGPGLAGERSSRALQRPGPPPEAYDTFDTYDTYDSEIWDDEEPVERYLVRPVRPVAQVAMRVVLWAAVALGCIGGIAALLRPPTEEVVVEPTTGEEAIPAPVVRVAELVVAEWLTATEEDRGRLDALFVEPPTLDDLDASGLTVERVTTVAGRPVSEGYWAITVAADVTDGRPLGGGPEGDAGSVLAAEASEEGEEGEVDLGPVRWYLEVAIVGDVEQGLAALTTPALVPTPPPLADDLYATAESPTDPGRTDPVAATVEGFLQALLAGNGDPTRYLAPGVAIDAASPAPFVDVRVEQIATEELADETEIWILAEVVATTPGGNQRPLTYDLYAVAAVDRWEVVAFSGTPTRTVRSEPEPDGSDGSDRSEEEADG